MPKKTRREKLRAARKPMNAPAAVPVRPIPQSGQAAPIPERVSPTVTSTRASVAAAQQTFDYTYVNRDLRRILLLAVTFFIILIALSFVIR